MRKKRHTFRKNFFILMSFVAFLIILITFLIYRNAITVIENEISNVNMSQVIQAEDNLSRAIERADRLSAGLCIDESVQLFWKQESPELANEEFYNRLYTKLKTYTYSLSDYVSSIMLYAPAFDRVMDQDMRKPYVLTNREDDQLQNIGWIEGLEEIDELVRTRIVYRRDSNNYPYVMTIIKQYKTTDGWGAVAIDIDLKKAYQVIWPEADDMLIWVVDEQDRVLIYQDKNELFGELSAFEPLRLFERTKEEKQLIWNEGEIPIAYAQRYCREYGLYIVGVSFLHSFRTQMLQKGMRAVGIGLICVIVSCVLVWFYVSLVNKPLKSILSVLENPLDYREYPRQTPDEVQEIVDRIVSNLQMNDTLREELEKRMESLRITQLQALKAQINPHFLFNTLNVIVALIDEEMEDSRASQVTIHLANILRYCLSDENLVILEDELEYTRKYLFVLEQRYQGNFRFTFDIETDLLNIKVPKLILQPLIENAVFHGIVPKGLDGESCLTISGHKEQFAFEENEVTAIRVNIIDNGIGMTAEEIGKVMATLSDEHISMNHIGVANVAKRLALLFPQNSRLEIRSEPGKGTCISLLFPYSKS